MTDKHTAMRTHYIHHLSYTARERLTGAFVLVAIALLFSALAFNQQTERFLPANSRCMPTCATPWV